MLLIPNAVLGIASRINVGRGVVFVLPTLRSALVAVVAGVVAVRPTILRGFVAPDVVGDVLVVELAAVGDPRWLVSPAVTVVVVFATALADPVAIFVVVLVLLGGLLLLIELVLTVSVLGQIKKQPSWNQKAKMGYCMPTQQPMMIQQPRV